MPVPKHATTVLNLVVVLVVVLLDKFVKCWTRAKSLGFLHKRQVEYGGLCNNKPILPDFVW